MGTPGFRVLTVVLFCRSPGCQARDRGAQSCHDDRRLLPPPRLPLRLPGKCCPLQVGGGLGHRPPAVHHTGHRQGWAAPLHSDQGAGRPEVRLLHEQGSELQLGSSPFLVAQGYMETTKSCFVKEFARVLILTVNPREPAACPACALRGAPAVPCAGGPELACSRKRQSCGRSR